MIASLSMMAPWIMWLCAIGVIERIHLHHLVESSGQVSIGATEAEVLAVLGEPNGRYDGIFSPRQWMYGTTINLRYLIVPELPVPNPLPINIRIFAYDEDDLVIDWSRDNKVSAIKRPAIEVPEGAIGLLRPLFLVRDLMQLVGAPAQ